MLRAILRLFALTSTVRAAVLSTVTLDYGTFTGVSNTSTGIVYFRGVRFADAPIGELRWRLPVSPPSTHLGLVNASAYGPACIPTSASDATATTSEDCLFGNVFLPIQTTPWSKLPVLVYFHGGGFEAGSAVSAPPENLIQGSKKPLIFVTFQYRLGQFGFLAGSKVAENGLMNAGLLDQRAALQWVQRYISKFGGDPSQVTIWGQSAGAGSTMYHLIAENGQNRGLFHRVMGDSPPILAMPHYTESFIEDLFTSFAANAGCSTAADTMACLRAASTKALSAAGPATHGPLSSALFPLGPIADGTFITQRPVEAFRSGRFIRVPVFFGSNTNEGTHWSAGLPNPAANTSEPFATQTTVYNFIAGQWTSLTRATFDEAVANYYPASAFSNFSTQGQQIYGEMRFICSALFITGTLRASGVKSYGYRWDNPILGSDHASELQMFFNIGQVFDPADSTLAIAMRQYWTSFATNGVPSADGAPTWEAAGTNGSPRMLLHPGQVGMEAVTNELEERCAFWHAEEVIGELDT
ncbi:Alpha/Beta hydrolase protein [Mycena amicta]|nr:Alpha/Beta hydrolase protein [Mycena amicta]KAJ7049231.1 Alpha/Beta hydrolase protein [Mycena amicta]